MHLAETWSLDGWDAVKAEFETLAKKVTANGFPLCERVQKREVAIITSYSDAAFDVTDRQGVKRQVYVYSFFFADRLNEPSGYSFDAKPLPQPPPPSASRSHGI